MLRLPSLIYRNTFLLPSLPPPDSFHGLDILVTGGTSGLGLASAVHFLNLGASCVTITGRTLSKGLIAKDEIEKQSGTTGKVHVRQLDLSTLEGVKEFVVKLKEEVKKLDVVLLNAGVLQTRFQKSAEGWEDSIQTNVLSTTLLALLLLPWLKEVGGGKAHLGIVGSGLHRGVNIEQGKWPQEKILEYWSQEDNWKKAGAPRFYDVSKLLLQYTTNEIAKLAVDNDGRSEVIVNSMCPGMVKTELGRQYKTNMLTSAALDAIMTLVMKTTEGGARSLVHAVLTKPEENGRYVTHYQSDEEYQKAAEHNVFGKEGQAMQEQVWKEVLNILKKTVPGVMDIARNDRR